MLQRYVWFDLGLVRPLSFQVRAGKVKKGDVIAMAGFGAGLTWAAAVLRYG